MGPTRDHFVVLQRMKAQWVPPCLPSNMWNVQLGSALVHCRFTCDPFFFQFSLLLLGVAASMALVVLWPVAMSGESPAATAAYWTAATWVQNVLEAFVLAHASELNKLLGQAEQWKAEKADLALSEALMLLNSPGVWTQLTGAQQARRRAVLASWRALNMLARCAIPSVAVWQTISKPK